MELEVVLKVIKELGVTFGPIVGTMLFLLIIIIGLILLFFQKRVGTIATEISEKSVSAFNKRIDLLFRDEVLRTNLRMYLGEKSFEKKLTLYDELCSLYFKYNNHWFFGKDTKEFDDLFNDVALMRKKIFLNSIYLGGDLYSVFSKIINGMLETLKNKTRGVKNPPDSEKKIANDLDEAKKWLEQKLITHQDMSMYEFSDEQKKMLEQEKQDFLNSGNSKQHL